MNEETVLSRRQRQRLKLQRADLEQVASSDAGKRFLARLFDSCGLFAPADSDVAEGRRRVALDVVRELNEINPHLVVGLMQTGANALVEMRTEEETQNVD